MVLNGVENLGSWIRKIVLNGVTNLGSWVKKIVLNGVTNSGSWVKKNGVEWDNKFRVMG